MKGSLEVVKPVYIARYLSGLYHVPQQCRDINTNVRIRRVMFLSSSEAKTPQRQSSSTPAPHQHRQRGSRVTAGEVLRLVSTKSLICMEIHFWRLFSLAELWMETYLCRKAILPPFFQRHSQLQEDQRHSQLQEDLKEECLFTIGELYLNSSLFVWGRVSNWCSYYIQQRHCCK